MVGFKKKKHIVSIKSYCMVEDGIYQIQFWNSINNHAVNSADEGDVIRLLWKIEDDKLIHIYSPDSLLISDCQYEFVDNQYEHIFIN
jgi:hypothetical protein